MDRERHRKLKEIFLHAADLEGAALEDYLAEACEGDDELLEEVRELIAVDRATPDDYLEGGAVGGRLETEPDAPTAPVGEWERYTDLEIIAKGGMGEVYRAFDPRLKRHAALKFIRAPSRKQVGRFLREAEAQARVAHDNVLEVYETGEVQGQLYIAMRYIDGPTLDKTRDETNVEEKVQIVIQVAEALHAAHLQGLVHRDIKPTNILMERSEDGRLKPYVMDFGIATTSEGPGLTTTGELLGTPWYMPPERVRFDASHTDRRGDIYSLGVTFFEYLSGSRPHTGNTPLEALTELKDSDPTPLRQVASQLSVDLETIVMKCLERDPDRRYQSARSLAEDLQRYLDGQPITARRATLSYRLLKRARRHRTVVAVIVIAAVILAAMGIATIRAWQQAREREELARDFARRVEKIDRVARMARVAPLHDASEERASIRRVMSEIRSRLEEAGLPGEGSGHYALGRAYIALDQHRRAREHLERAWTRGYRGPEVALALGQVLGTLYQESLTEAEHISDPVLRKRRLEELETDLRRPAVRNLRLSAGVGAESPEQVDALVAFLEGSFDEALDLARQGVARLPWLYEAHKLEGDIHNRAGLERWHLGEVTGALESWNLGLSAYQRATAVARSDAASFIAICNLGRSMVELELRDRDGAVDSAFEIAREACERALVIDSEMAEAHWLLSNLHSQRAEAAMLSDGDPRGSLEAAARSAQRAFELRPDDAHSQIALGDAWLAETRFEISAGSDPERSLATAITHFERATDRDPSSPEAQGRLGQAWLERATLDADREIDPNASLESAIAALANATTIARYDIHTHEALGLTHLHQARHLQKIGKDPSGSLQQAQNALATTVTINPGYGPGHRLIGECLELRAAWRHASGLDARVDLKQARDAYERAAALESDEEDLSHIRDALDRIEGALGSEQALAPVPGLATW